MLLSFFFRVYMRAEFHRYLSEKRDLEIINNPQFCAHGQLFKASITRTNFIESIEKHYFNSMTSQRLQHLTFFIEIDQGVID